MTQLHARSFEAPVRAVRIPAPHGPLHGDLALPAGASGIVVFAHGSGSGRHSPRNRLVARGLQQAGLATFLMDLLSDREDAAERAGAMLRFDVQLLAERLVLASEWLGSQAETRELRSGYFGASTGAAAALIAAAERRDYVGAVVSRGGRPDLVSADVLGRVSAPCLFIVGGEDAEVLELNRWAYAHLRCKGAFEVVPGASHLFEEPGRLEEVARLARDWFVRWLGAGARSNVGTADLDR